MIVTPYLTEVKRYREKCNCKPCEPQFTEDGNKHDNLMKLIEQGYNIVTTHSLFLDFTVELAELCWKHKYCLVIDEAPNIFSTLKISKYDLKFLIQNFIELDAECNRLRWKSEFADYDGRFNDIKELCDMGALVYSESTGVAYRSFPYEVFSCFRETYLLTYMFHGSLMQYFFDYHKIPYEMKSIGRDPETGDFYFGKWTKPVPTVNYRDLIHICNNRKMNAIGNDFNALSKSWYMRANDEDFTTMKKHLKNYFINLHQSCSERNLWTTYDKWKDYLSGRGYTKGFIALNKRATNEYINCDCVAYTVNRFIDPYVKNFFVKAGVKVDEDAYALSEMLQFIWRSAIRTGKPINLYIPSSRMRGLLEKWIEENSVPA